MKVSDRNDWFELWKADKKSIISTMQHNMQADLNVGYDPNGKSITEQKNTIECYERSYQCQLEDFKSMTEKQVNRWCFYDMIQRGVIEG